MRPFITMGLCSTLPFSQAVQAVGSVGGETYSGDLFTPFIGAAVPLLSTLGATAIFLPPKNIIGTAGFINAEETTGYDPSERGHGTTFLTEWHIGYTLAGLPGKSTVGFVFGFDRKKLDFGTDPRLQLASLLRTGDAVQTNVDTWALYYNAVFTPWQHVTADVHYIDSALH
ncbi:MAG: hypothetical protein ACR65O_12410 [Methylomicrobium sp.]|jgi:hypothetical protein